MEISGEVTGAERARAIARHVDEWVREHIPEAGAEVYIPVSDMHLMLQQKGWLHHGRSENSGRKWLDGICSSYAQMCPEIGRLSLVKRMTGTWVWRWDNSKQAGD